MMHGWVETKVQCTEGSASAWTRPAAKAVPGSRVIAQIEAIRQAQTVSVSQNTAREE
ncbi:hypothetical protein [Dethiosulfatarculus sandiegensis]|uniref:Uncharacterized protein n=1 Tax=Dethiosulfatarculus sandiegensis TaxID=1429043 RepID=A0A0D2HQU9_9BACT|nr:hypothetical protein [Dethiosulfatarculus sandiegensis]KIX12853.1 hypothetical protein X474_17395 [Dethiosulfatarculus sandiegensis]